MRWLLSIHCLRYAHWASIVIPVLWWGLSYFFWLERGCRPFLPFISDFDLFAPEDTIFTVGVCLTALVLLIRVLQLFLTQQEQILALHLNHRWTILNRFSLIPAAIGLVSTVWLAQVPWNEDFWLHKGLADAIFISGVSWCACATGLTWRRSRETASLKLGLRWRIAGSFAAAIGLLGMTLTMHRVRMDDQYDIDARMQLSLEEPLTYCQTSSMPGVDLASAFEWLLVLGILFVIWTFSSELQATRPPSHSDTVA